MYAGTVGVALNAVCGVAAWYCCGGGMYCGGGAYGMAAKFACCCWSCAMMLRSSCVSLLIAAMFSLMVLADALLAICI